MKIVLIAVKVLYAFSLYSTIMDGVVKNTTTSVKTPQGFWLFLATSHTPHCCLIGDNTRKYCWEYFTFTFGLLNISRVASLTHHSAVFIIFKQVLNLIFQLFWLTWIQLRPKSIDSKNLILSSIDLKNRFYLIRVGIQTLDYD